VGRGVAFFVFPGQQGGKMGTEVIQIKAEEDGCVYIYNFLTRNWSKLCDVKAPELPNSVTRKIQEVQRSTANGGTNDKYNG
jgi:hypothetical protein